MGCYISSRWARSFHWQRESTTGGVLKNMKLVVMSDTHLSDVTDPFRAICDKYCHDADMVIHLGDWTRAAVLDYLERYPLQAVAGNMDDHQIHSRLPVKRVIQVNRFRIGIIHGWGAARDLRSRLKTQFADVHAVFFGHTHQPLQMEEDGLFWFNPGSVFSGRGQIQGSVGVVHVDRQLQGEIIVL
jgi:putative phosphoesterase